jgi:predicted polyphosphate/ATP-dependent NAD kinase
MRVIVCGGRGPCDTERVHAVLDWYHSEHPIGCLMEGGATGVDAAAATWAIEHDVGHMTFEAYWANEGLSAGPKRNTRMLMVGADVVIAFPGGPGTADMVQKANKKEIPVIKVGW